MSLILKPSALSSDKPIFCMLYGQPGAGKTSLAISSDSPLLIDFDHGLHRVRKKHQVPSVQVNTYDDMLEVFGDPDIAQFKTIVIDTAGKMIESLGEKLCKVNPKYRSSDGTFSIKCWGVIKNNFQNLLIKLRELNKNVIFVAHEKEEKDGDKKILRPDIAGSSGKDIIKDLDLLGYVEMIGNKRTVSFAPCERYYAKNSANLANWIEIPNNDLENTFFKKCIMKKIRESREQDNIEALEYEQIVATQGAKIEDLQTIEQLNAIYAELLEEKSIWDSVFIWKRKLADKCKELNCAFNKETGAFEQCYN